MRALRFAEFGSPEVLRIDDVGIPEPVKGESLILVKAAAIGIPYITAWASVADAAQIQPGETMRGYLD